MLIRITNKLGVEKIATELKNNDIVYIRCDKCHKEYNFVYRKTRQRSFDLCFDCSRKETNLEKFGYENCMDSPELKDNYRSTMLEKYSVNNPWKSKQVRQKIENTLEERYGVKNPLQNPEFLDKMKQTNLEKYGTEWPQESEEIRLKIKTTNSSDVVKDKIKKTNLERFGVENPMQNEEIKNKAWSGNLKERNNKREETCIEKYGVKSTTQLQPTKEKIRKTNLERYGFDNYVKTQEHKKAMNLRKDEIYNKINKTKRKNGTFNTSEPEEKAYELLKEKFTNVIRQYKEIRYPFACDFYISEIDLFIECNFNWTHSKKSFSPKDKKDLEKVKLWESKIVDHPFYKVAIETWTIRDPLKRKTVKKNNLNYLEFFSFQDLEKFLNDA